MDRAGRMAIISILGLQLCSCSNQNNTPSQLIGAALNNTQPAKISKPQPGPDSCDIFKNYCARFVLAPLQIIQNSNYRTRQFRLGKHLLRCENNEESGTTTFSIDKQRYQLADYRTLNNVYGEKDNLDFPNTWSEASRYVVDGNEILVIGLVFEPCTGIGCGVAYYLVYDCAAKKASFFGSFRGYPTGSLYRFSVSSAAQFLASSYTEPASDSIRREYQLFERRPDGRFRVVEQKPAGPWRVIQHSDMEQKTCTIEAHWFEPVR